MLTDSNHDDVSGKTNPVASLDPGITNTTPPPKRNKGDRTSGKRVDKHIFRKVAKTVFSVFVCMLLCGYFLGRARSINYDDPSLSPPFIELFVSQSLTVHDTDRITSSRNGQGNLESLTPADEISFVC